MNIVQIREISTGATMFVDPNDTIPYGWELVPELTFELDLGLDNACECGSDKIGGPGHSSWCPKAKETKC